MTRAITIYSDGDLVRKYQGENGRWYDSPEAAELGVKIDSARESARQRKTLEPPTDRQIDHIRRMKEKLSGEDLDYLIDAIQNRGMLKNKGTIGVLIHEIDKRVLNSGGTLD